MGALALAAKGRVGRVVAAAGLGRGLGYLQGLLQQRFDGARGGLAGGAVEAGRIISGQQPLALRLLAQQFGAGALAQQLVGQLLARCMQGDAVDAGDGVVHGRGGAAAAAAGWRSAGGGRHENSLQSMCWGGPAASATADGCRRVMPGRHLALIQKAPGAIIVIVNDAVGFVLPAHSGAAHAPAGRGAAHRPGCQNRSRHAPGA